MITVIVCSINKDLLEKLRNNIAATIGVDHEMLVTDNSIEQRSIAAVYNEAAAKARFPFLCFVHEDVIIHTKGWGQKVIDLLGQKDIGLVGISGAVYKSAYPASWSACDPSLYRTHSIQHFTNTREPKVTNTNVDNIKYAEVVVIDGVFMATTKKIFADYVFDEQLLKGFNGYDLDYSISVGRHSRVVVTYEILLEHLSEGNLNESWLNDSILFHRKWKKQLPVQSTAITKKEKRRSDYRSISSVLNVVLKYPGYKKEVVKYFCKLLLYFADLNGLKYSRMVLKYLLR